MGDQRAERSGADPGPGGGDADRASTAGGSTAGGSTPGGLFELILTTDEIAAATSDAAWLEALLRFESELAAAEAEVGIVPPEAAAAIAGAAARLVLRPAELGRASRATGNPVVPMVRALAEAAGAPGAGYVHHGATSQDALDTAAMLVARKAGRLILDELDSTAAACADLAARHGGTVLAGRTLLQQALPVTFALKVAGWLVAVVDAATRLDEVLERRLALQLGGAAGTLASLGEDGPAVSARLAGRLGLVEAPLPWHSDRVRLAELAAALSIAAGAVGRIALDVILLSQTEVDEVLEPGGPGRGGSSTLPHKRNPIGSVLAEAAARRAQGLASLLVSSMLHEHERAAGAWQVEWETLTELLRAAGGAAANVAAVLGGLEVHAERMATNLGVTGGVLMAERVVLDLSPELGRDRARSLVEAASRSAIADHRTLRELLGEEEAITAVRTPDQLDRLCDPTDYLGSSAGYVERALTTHAAYRLGREARGSTSPGPAAGQLGAPQVAEGGRP